MRKPFIACVASLAISAVAMPSAFAETTASEGKLAQTDSERLIVQQQKTSDRTPGDPAPHRTPGANIWGAAGVDGAHTSFGTSDRTPENHYLPVAH